MNVEKGLLYTKDHEWVKVEGDTAYIGIADFAQSNLGDIVYVELPEEDDEVSAKDSIASVESVKAAAEVFSPVDGTVVEINEDLDDDPGLLNKAPYEHWIAKVELSDKSQLDELMNDAEYTDFLKEA
ncbi:glycine cleavage system protein GcvH [Miniphocaeibacter halophilus]|uniref:Glycine cleavage system protein GcvH n=1 Tax=Miniphocaeibacter halophilus TaxID=2931922 RepID=A0AC61MQE4_9FIRM|nr:glycine cleavage system protein GcvH [Miniphocaeibacter halophilus]QQK07887.1 glycine cleavage system protein GcvH [Miniphocaeibacter halophilus]